MPLKNKKACQAKTQRFQCQKFFKRGFIDILDNQNDPDWAKQAEYAVKKYCSHHRVGVGIMMDIVILNSSGYIWKPASKQETLSSKGGTQHDRNMLCCLMSGRSFSFFILSYCYLILSYYLATSGIEPKTCRHMARSGPCYDLGGSRPT